ncbi:hypothetical protein Mapa_005699 [Marchantia paleacea]|nr:hypothetical protein Mapa_005699 [Marchantia paleacea]
MASNIYTQMLIAVAVTLVLASGDAHGYSGNYGGLRENYYSKTCPKAISKISGLIKYYTKEDKTLPAALIRLHFHDCFVNGCDGSVLLDSTPTNLAEKDAIPNRFSLRGFEIIDKVKEAIEELCPGVVSCSDILSLAARESISFKGGPRWRVPLGRRDSLDSIAEAANVSLPIPTMNYDELVENFANVGLNERDMVILSGAHTIGEAHCAVVMPRLYNFPGSPDGMDPSLDRKYAEKLKQKCPPGAELTLIPMDPSFGGQRFDNNYYRNIVNKKALFGSDNALIQDKDGRAIVSKSIISPKTFFREFGLSMEKMGKIAPLTGSRGEIRRKCSAVNPPATYYRKSYNH